MHMALRDAAKGGEGLRQTHHNKRDLEDYNLNDINFMNGRADQPDDVGLAALPSSIKDKLLAQIFQKVPTEQEISERKILLQKMHELQPLNKIVSDEHNFHEAAVHRNHEQIDEHHGQFNADPVDKPAIEPDTELMAPVPGASVNKEVAWLLGLLAVLVSCILSAFSGVYFERIVKRSRQTSLLIRNVQLGK